MFIPIGLLISLLIASFLLGVIAVPLLIVVILKTPLRMQPQPVPKTQR